MHDPHAQARFFCDVVKFGWIDDDQICNFSFGKIATIEIEPIALLFCQSPNAFFHRHDWVAVVDGFLYDLYHLQREIIKRHVV